MGGVPEGFDAVRLLAELAQGTGPVCHIARDDKRLAAMATALSVFNPSVPVLLFPGWDCLPFDRASPNADNSAARMATLAALAAGLSGQFIVLTTLNAATQYVPPRDLLRGSAFLAEVGKRINESDLRNFLLSGGEVTLFRTSPTLRGSETDKKRPRSRSVESAWP